MTKKLHELIALAREGKKFRAFSHDDLTTNKLTLPVRDNEFFIKNDLWSSDELLADWTYEEIKEPLKLEFEAKVIRHEYAGCSVNNLTLSFGDIGELYLNGKRFKVTMQEIV